MNSGPTVHRGSGTSAGSPPGSLNESQSRSMVHFCVSRRVRERVARGQKKIKREKKKKKSFFPLKAHHFRPYQTASHEVVGISRLRSTVTSLVDKNEVGYWP